MQSHLVYKTLGSLAALVSAAAWAFSTILFRKLGDKASPIGMNLGKCIIGILYVGVILSLFGIEPIDNRTILFLGFSGLLGIAFGDTFYFKALIYLGPRLTILLGTLGPVVTVILALVFLQEKLSILAWLGIILSFSNIFYLLLSKLDFF